MPRRFVLALERWRVPANIVNAVAAMGKLIALAGLVVLALYYAAFLFGGGKDGVDWWLSFLSNETVIAWSWWIIPLALYWLVSISFLGRSLSGLAQEVARLKDRLPAKYDPRADSQASYLNYHTPGDEPGLGLRLQGLITWIIQTLILATTCVLAAGIVLAVVGGIEALFLHPWFGGHGFLSSVGMSPKLPDQQSRFVTMIDVLTFLPATAWSALQAIPGLSALLGAPAVRLGSLPNAGEIAEYVPLALVNAVMNIMFGLLPLVAVALAVGFAMSRWLRNNYFVGFGSERFAWTLANRIAVVRRGGTNSMLRQITISPEAWWKRDIAHCYYYKSDVVTKDVASQIAHPEHFKPDEPGLPVEHIVASTLRWAMVALFVLGIFSMAVPIAQRQHAAAEDATPKVLTAEKERALKPGAAVPGMRGQAVRGWSSSRPGSS